MNRKLIISASALILVMLAAIGISVAVLYSGVESEEASSVPDDARFMLLPAVPSDAVAVCCFSDAENVLGKILSRYPFCGSLAAASDAEDVDLGRMSVSLHYVGELQPLYVFDAGDAGDAQLPAADVVVKTAGEAGLFSRVVDCSAEGVSRKLGRRSVVMVSPSENLIKSAIRHLQKSVSVMDAAGFPSAASHAGDDVAFISNVYAGKIISSSLTRKYHSKSSFAERVSDWVVLDLEKLSEEWVSLDGVAVSEDDASVFFKAVSQAGSDGSRVSQMLPSYTFSAMRFSLKDYEKYLTSYAEYLDYSQMLRAVEMERTSLRSEKGISPVDFYRKSGVREAVTASFICEGKLASVNLVRVSDLLTEYLFAGVQVPDMKNYKPQVHPYGLSGYAAAAFGNLFRLEDESCFTYMDGWIVSGSREAVGAYADGSALSYNLKEYMANAGLQDMFAQSASFMAYMSFSESDHALGQVFRKGFLTSFSGFRHGEDYCGAFVMVGGGDSAGSVNVRLFRQNMERSKAPVVGREVSVEVSKGPFKVKNSGTGRNNIFVQAENNCLSLKEESGKGIWSVPFSKPICGRVHNVDFYSNGKIQFLFGAGSELYLIDRLGRFVKGFPVGIGKEILLGPDVYDFSGGGKYNVMVLHKDNTIDMYNLKGQKPASWKGISPGETITDLPERIVLSGNTFWVVRTAVQTLIYPFGGGEPLTKLDGDSMAMPDTEVKIVDKTSVEVKCYDGRSRTLKLK